MAVHFVADLHFNGDCARHAHPHGFADSAEMTRRICDVWRSRVEADDVVWIVGNVGNAVHLADLPGIKHLVRGGYDPQAWNCLSTRRYASVSEYARIDMPDGSLYLTSNPMLAPFEDGISVLHGQTDYEWVHDGHYCVSASLTGWGPVRFEDLTSLLRDVRQAA